MTSVRSKFYRTMNREIHRTLVIVAFVVSFYSFTGAQVVDMLTDEEFYRIFRMQRDRAPEYEFVKLNPLSVTQLKRRLSSRTRILSFDAFGQHYDLQLKPRDNVLVGKNTPIWHVESNPLNSFEINYTLLSNVLDNINGIYQDPINMVSLLETRYSSNEKVSYDGMISADLAISPLPQRLIHMMSNASDDNEIKDHVIYKIIMDNSTSDYIAPAIEATKKYDRKQMRLEPLQILYPEVLIVVDYSFYKHLGHDPRLAMNYLMPFWNGVDLRYRLLKSPEVKLNIAGIILAKDEMSLRFVYNNLDDLGRINAKKALIDAGEYFYTQTKFITSKDVVVIMTKRDLCSTKYSSYCKSSTLGKAFTGKACSRKKNTAVFEDNGGYAGIITATHEIGHLLGLPHDGEEEAANCSIKDGFIMASAKYRSVNSLCWSSCSKKILEQFASLTASNCLENKPANLGGFVNQALPGKVLTIEEQCLARGGKPCVFNATVCWKLHCTKSMTNTKCIGKAPAAEGTKCGYNLYCRNGECVAEITKTFQNNL